MTLQNSVNKLLNIKSGEENTVALLFSFSFLIGICVVFYETAAYTLFLSRFSAENLPYIYIGAAILIILCGTLYNYIEERFDFIRLMIATLLSLGLGIVLLTVYQYMDPGSLSAAIIALWSDAIAMLVGLAFWSLSGRLLTLRQGKRLFPLISTGEVIAAMIGGVSISLLVSLIGTTNLLFIAAAALIACTLLFLVIARRYREDLLRDEEESEEQDDEEGMPTKAQEQGELIHWRSRYMLLLAGLAGCSLIGYYFVDYLFYSAAEEIFPEEEQLAAFLGLFFAGVGFVNLLFKSLAAGRLLNRYGMIFGLFFLPVLILLGTFIALFMGWLTDQLTIIFLFLAAIKLFDTIGRIAVEEPAFMILYQPLPVDFRHLAQARIESVGEPVASILAGVLLLVISHLGFAEPNYMLFFLLLLIVGWLVMAFYVRGEYWVTLANAISNRTIGSGVHLALDQNSLEVLQQRLDSPHIGEVIYMLNLLEQEHEELLEPALLKLLRHADPKLQLDVLERIERQELRGLEGEVRKLIRDTQDPQVRGAAIRTFSAITSSDIFEEIAPLIEHTDPLVRRNALVGLLRSGGIEGVLNAGEKFYGMAKSKDPRRRMVAAEVLGEVGIESFYRPLLTLFQDRYREVREAAFTAAGKLGNPRLWPALVENLHNRQLRRCAEQALIQGGPSTLPELTKVFITPDTPREVQLAILRIIGHYPAEQMMELALYAASDDSPQIRHQALRALNAARFHADDGEQRKQVQEVLHIELAQAAQLLITIRDLSRRTDHDLLISDLRAKFKQVQRRLFLLLHLQFGRKQGRQLEKNYYSEDREKHAYALEMLSNILEQSGLAIVLVVLDDITEGERLIKLNRAYPSPTGSPDFHLKEIILGNRKGITFWTQCIAIYEVGKQRRNNLYPTVKQAMMSPEKFIRETAVWAIAELNPVTAPAVVETFAEDRAPNVRRIANQICAKLVQEVRDPRH